MEEGFKLPITYKGQEKELEATLTASGYTHKFHVDIDGVGVFFEPDEERNYRAVLDPKSIELNLSPNLDLLRLVGNKLEELFKQT
ncbi:hypothetical protein [Pedobacter sp. SYSU D00535]|uniref:hypothetical protein n=1 Tax=Pedobacter sp. SYSU D00535 TaxID=2810308 RepID=UPI001A9678D2|nr:hypothetical protein [Pedobacter sp. SYSU D00535]